MKRSNKKIFMWTLLAVAIIVIVRSVSITPVYIDEDKKAIEKEVAKIHSLFNEGKYDEIIKIAVPSFTETLGREKMILAMNQTKTDFGTFSSTYEKWINVIVNRIPNEGRAIYNCKFSKSDATETFIFFKEDKTYKLASYQIFPGIVKPEINK